MSFEQIAAIRLELAALRKSGFISKAMHGKCLDMLSLEWVSTYLKQDSDRSAVSHLVSDVLNRTEVSI